MTETAEMQAKPVAWRWRYDQRFAWHIGILELSDGIRNIAEVEPLYSQSDFDAMRAQRDEARETVDRLTKIAAVLGKWGFEMSSLKQLGDLEDRAKAAGLRIEDLGPFTVGATLSELSPSNSGDTP